MHNDGYLQFLAESLRHVESAPAIDVERWRERHAAPAEQAGIVMVATVEDYDFGPPSDETCTACQRGVWDGRKALSARTELGCPNPECDSSKGRKHTMPGFVKLENDGEEPKVYIWTTEAEARALTRAALDDDAALKDRMMRDLESVGVRDPSRAPTPDDAWLSRYVASAGQLTTAAARVALADAAPGAFLRDTGLEPPSDLIARVFAALTNR